VTGENVRRTVLAAAAAACHAGATILRLDKTMRPLAALLLALFLPFAATPAKAACAGSDLIAAMPVADRAALDAAVAAAPFATGNHWRAQRGERTIHLIGTLHLTDPRMAAIAERLGPVIARADRVYLEATDAETEALQQAIARQPDLIFTTGPTLPERLSRAEWAALSEQMRTRGIPPFLASKFRPWYLSVLLALPPCAMPDLAGGGDGLDRRVIEAARAADRPMQALEPYDTVFRAFDRIAPDEQIDVVRDALALADQAEDMLATMKESYFREEHRQIWEFGRRAALAADPSREAKVRADFALMEEVLVSERNGRWLDVILADPAAFLVVAVGAGHLSGDQGLLRGLERAGFTLDRQAF
jgi:uncharacterized protein YbaP (TraB family)